MSVPESVKMARLRAKGMTIGRLYSVVGPEGAPAGAATQVKIIHITLRNAIQLEPRPGNMGKAGAFHSEWEVPDSKGPKEMEEEAEKVMGSGPVGSLE
ncbi:hypothetical protein NDU88_001915 [Pleurodeles waltl]|uniref:Uncharacterized protein n=1 Tax=Pleurodeles waltl TaxID=8319 RepID=A0AAV7TJ72_PLEWA|nr:hypothetical protein NDU88_001915 [Pleurodeles waltl]